MDVHTLVNTKWGTIEKLLFKRGRGPLFFGCIVLNFYTVKCIIINKLVIGSFTERIQGLKMADTIERYSNLELGQLGGG